MEYNLMINQSEKTFREKFGILISFFIRLNIKDEFLWKENDWARERKACSILLKRYPDFDFFYFLPEFYNKFNSLFGLTNKENKNKLDIKYKEWQDKKSKEIKLEKNPLITLELENKKAKSLLEFLDS